MSVANAHRYPARGTIDGFDQLAKCLIIRHLGEIFDVDVQKAWLIGFEGFDHRLRLAVSQSLQFAQLSDTVPV